MSLSKLFPLAAVSLCAACVAELNVLDKTPVSNLPDGAVADVGMDAGADAHALPDAASLAQCGWEKNFYKPIAAGACSSPSGKCLARYDAQGNVQQVVPVGANGLVPTGEITVGANYIAVHAKNSANMTVVYLHATTPQGVAGAAAQTTPWITNVMSAHFYGNELSVFSAVGSMDTYVGSWNPGDQSASMPSKLFTPSSGEAYGSKGLRFGANHVLGLLNREVFSGKMPRMAPSIPEDPIVERIVYSELPVLDAVLSTNGDKAFYTVVPEDGTTRLLSVMPKVASSTLLLHTFEVNAVNYRALAYRAQTGRALVLRRDGLVEAQDSGTAPVALYSYTPSLGANPAAGVLPAGLQELEVDNATDTAYVQQPCGYDASTFTIQYGVRVIPLTAGSAPPRWLWEEASFPLVAHNIASFYQNQYGAYRIVDAN